MSIHKGGTNEPPTTPRPDRPQKKGTKDPMTTYNCSRCNDTGVWVTGNNDLPCEECPRGATAVFSSGRTGREVLASYNPPGNQRRPPAWEGVGKVPKPDGTTWNATMQLRWRIHIDYVSFRPPPQLEQLWQSSEGEKEWRAVPTEITSDESPFKTKRRIGEDDIFGHDP